MRSCSQRGLAASLAFFAFAASAAFLAFVPRFAVLRTRPVITLAVAFAAAIVAFHPRARRIADFISASVMRPSPKAFGWIVFAAGTVWFSSVSLRVFLGTPVLDDDAAALFQSKIFLSGHLRVPAPTPPEFFHQFAIISGIHGSKWLCAMYPFGHALVLLPFLALGVPWMAMPTCAAAACAVATSLARILFGERVARLSALMLLASPAVAELSATYLNHAPTALGILVAARSLVLCLGLTGGDSGADGCGRLWHGIQIGIGLSLAFLCRPGDAAVCGLAFAALVLARPRLAWKARAGLAAAAAVFASALALHFAWTQLQTGNWRVPGHVLFMGKTGKYGFTDFFTPKDAVRNAFDRAMEFAAKATGWPIPFFVPALLALAPTRMRRRAAWLWSFPLLLSAFYFFFFWYEICFPARYLSVALAPAAILAAAGCRVAADFFGVSLARTCLVPAAVGLLVFLPFHLRSFDDHWHDIERLLPRVVERAGLRNAVVIHDDIGRAVDRADRARGYFASAFMLNDPDFGGNVVYVRNLRSRNAELPGLFPGRDVYLYRYRRNKNLAELYLETFDPETGTPTHQFIRMPGLRGYSDPDTDGITIPDAEIIELPGR